MHRQTVGSSLSYGTASDRDTITLMQRSGPPPIAKRHLSALQLLKTYRKVSQDDPVLRRFFKVWSFSGFRLASVPGKSVLRYSWSLKEPVAAKDTISLYVP